MRAVTVPAARARPGRGWSWPWVLGALAAIGLLSWYILAGVPAYSFYRFVHAIRSHDAAGAVEYVDVDRVAGTATELLVADYFAHQGRPSDALETMGQRLALQTMKPQVAARVDAEIRRMAERGVMPVGPFALVFGGVEIKRDGDQAWVSYVDPRQGATRFKMSRQPDRSWKVTEFDPDWIRRQMRPHPDRREG